MLARYGDPDAEYRLASVTKPLVARAAQVAVEEGVVDLDTPAGPPGSTVRHLLAHASGMSMNSAELMAEPGNRRVYSNYGFQVLAETVEERSGIEFGRYLTEAVFEPLGMAASRLPRGAAEAGYGAVSTVADLAAFGPDLLEPRTVSAQMHQEATSVAVPGPDRSAARFRRTAAQRLGPGIRDPRRQVSALDGDEQLAPDVRPFRPDGHLHLGRSRPRAGAGSARRPAISTSGPNRCGRHCLMKF